MMYNFVTTNFSNQINKSAALRTICSDMDIPATKNPYTNIILPAAMRRGLLAVLMCT